MIFQNTRRHGPHHIGIDIARRYRVDGNSLGSAFLRQLLGESVNSGFGCSVIDLALLACLSVDRSDIDDAAEFSFPHPVDHAAAHIEA